MGPCGLLLLSLLLARPKIMVERLDAPQPTFSLPPLADIPDEDIDKADEAKRIVSRHA